MSRRERLRYCRLVEYRRLVLAAQYEREGRDDLARPLATQAFEALRHSYNGSLWWRCWVAPVTHMLYRRVVAGKRGAARIAQRIF